MAKAQVEIPLAVLGGGNVSLAVPEPAPEVAIDVVDVELSYAKKVPVLDGLSMHVPRGSIYGLLGPSGCGKTSLIRCILGMVQPNAGSISVFGQHPGSPHVCVPGSGVGYMPQDISLFLDLTMHETLHYFGSLFGLNKAQCLRRIETLVSFLDLPNTDRLVGVLSGGQKRRVSLATALIHNPPLLVLDEPTVGVDPLLRRSIWEHLIDLSVKNRMTVLITTHYIEEAKDANLVGLMRNGTILAQDSPDGLLATHQLSTLEKVFLHLCTEAEQQADQGPDLNQVVVQQSQSDKPSRKSSTSSNSSGVHSLHDAAEGASKGAVAKAARMEPVTHRSVGAACQVKAMMRKNVQTLRRNKAMMTFQLGLPTIEVILFCLCIGLKLHSIPVAVFDGDETDLSAQIRETLDPTIIRQTMYNSPQEAIAAVRNGVASTALIMYANFSNCLFERMMLLGDVPPEVLRNSTIHLHPDMSNQLMVISVQEEVVRSFLTVGKSFLIGMGVSPHLLDLPVMLEEPVYGQKDPAFTEYMAPGVIASIAFLAAIPLTTMALVVEHKNGLIERTRVAGASYFRILLSHLLPQMGILFVQVLPLMLLVFPIFGIPYHGEFLLILGLTYLQSVCGMCFGLFVSTIARDENTATMLALGFFYPNLLLSGTVWPTEAMNDYVRYLSYCLPQTLPILSMRNMITRGWDFFHFEVACGFGVTLIWIVGLLLVSTVISHWRKL